MKATCGLCPSCAKGWRNSKKRYRVSSDKDCTFSIKRGTMAQF